MNNTHAPAPWSINIITTNEHAESRFILRDSKDDDIATIHGQDFWGEGIGKANATLIASAPELLAALKGVLRVADRATDEFDAARAAISKAEGETI